MESLSSVLLEGRWGPDNVLSTGHGFEERVRDTPSYSLSLGELWWRGQTLAGRIGIARHVKKMSCCTVRSQFDVGLGLVLNPLVYTCLPSCSHITRIFSGLEVGRNCEKVFESRSTSSENSCYKSPSSVPELIPVGLGKHVF